MAVGNLWRPALCHISIQIVRMTILSGICLTVNAAVFRTMATGKNPTGDKGDSPCANFTIVSRAEWGAKPPKSRVDMTIPVPFAIVHHTATKQCHTLEECCAMMRYFQKMHMEQKGWDDIGYNFLIGGDARVYVGRGWETVGTQAGSKYYNHHSQGVSLVGDYTKVLPSPRMLDVLNQLLECGMKSGYLIGRYVLRGHRDVRQLGPTECPGNALYAKIRTWPHYLEPQDKTNNQ